MDNEYAITNYKLVSKFLRDNQNEKFNSKELAEALIKLYPNKYRKKMFRTSYGRINKQER